MSVWAVTMVKDEIDIIVTTLSFLCAGGVDGIIVADNGSTDGTLDMICRYARGPGLPKVIIRTDDEVGYYQSRKMTALAHEAFGLGADWVIPFDADEIWYVPPETHGRLVDAIERWTETDVDVLNARLYNYFPTSSDNKRRLDPTARITWHDPRPAPLPKVIVRNIPGVVIAQGNHGATGPRPLKCVDTPITIAHFPWRSFGQFERKVRHGYAAYQATDLPAEQGAHWRQYGEILETQGTRALRDVYFQWFHDPPLVLQRTPCEEIFDAIVRVTDSDYAE